MLLLTGATGRVGSALLPRLTARGEAVRCLVRDPRRLGPARVRVQIALGDLADPASFRHALRGVRTVVHLAGAWRDQPAAGLEELNGLATWRLLRAAERAGVERFVFLTPLGAVAAAPAARAPRQGARRGGGRGRRAGDDDARLLADLRAGRVAPAAAGRPRPTRACSRSRRRRRALPARRARPPAGRRTSAYELAGPAGAELARVRRAGGRPPRARASRRAALRPALHAYEALAGPAALLTWDEAARATAPR